MANGQTDPESGREALQGSYTGQILSPIRIHPTRRRSRSRIMRSSITTMSPLPSWVRFWKNPFKPDVSDVQFPEGSMVVKVEGVTLAEDDWPILKNSSLSYIYRPNVASPPPDPDPTKRPALVTEMRFLQMAVRVKDKIASPDTGWVFIAFAYDTRSTGATVWDRAIPVGAMWGNDPLLAKYPNGLGPNGKLQETWVNDGLPSFITDGLGWGGRLAGPLDVGIRHNAEAFRSALRRQQSSGVERVCQLPQFCAVSLRRQCVFLAEHGFPRRRARAIPVLRPWHATVGAVVSESPRDGSALRQGPQGHRRNRLRHDARHSH